VISDDLIEYLLNAGDYIHSYPIKDSPSKYNKKSKKIWPILGNGRGGRFWESRHKYLNGTTNLKDSIGKIMVLIQYLQSWIIQVV